MVDCFSFSLFLGSKNNCFFRRHFFSLWFTPDQTLVLHRIPPLHPVASSQTHDLFSQEANTLSLIHVLKHCKKPRAWRHQGVTHVPLVTRLYAVRSLKKVDVDLYTVCFSWTFSDARSLGLLFMVCACVVGLRENRLTRMRGTWGPFGRSAHEPTTPFTWLRRVHVLGQTAHASLKTMWTMWIKRLCERVLYSMGSREFPCPNMGIDTSLGSRGINARCWLVDPNFPALWLVTAY